MNALETASLTKVLGRAKVVNAVSMHVENGAIYGLVGDAGSGKTTLLSLASGLMAADTGEVILFGNRSTRYSRTRVGVMLGPQSTIGYLTALDNLMIKALASGLVDARARCIEVLDTLGVNDIKVRVRYSSVDQRVRIRIALALVNRPDLLLLDEPFVGLDSRSSLELSSTLLTLNEETGITIVMASRRIGWLQSMATHYGVLKQGRLQREVSMTRLLVECDGSIRLRTVDLPRVMVLLEESLGPDCIESCRDMMTGEDYLCIRDTDEYLLSGLLHDMDAEVLEMYRSRRSPEEVLLDGARDSS